MQSITLYLEALMSGPKRQRDIALPKTSKYRAWRRLMADGLIERLADGSYKPTTAGYTYAIQDLSLIPQAAPYQLPATEEELIDKLDEAGKMVQSGGDWTRLFQKISRAGRYIFRWGLLIIIIGSILVFTGKVK